MVQEVSLEKRMSLVEIEQWRDLSQQKPEI